MEPEVSVKGLGYRYRGQQKPALDGVDLEVAKGEFVVVMGPSGAGKSTLCVSLNGLIPHFFRGRMEGEVRVGGRSTREGRVGEFAQEVGLVFQDFEAQLFSTNVALEVAFGPENFAVEREEMVRRVERVLGEVRLEGFENRTPATLSGGQKQRLAIASVLAIEPRILCLDEPTTDLDPIGKLGIFEIAEDLKDRDDVTLIVVEHETEETLDADRIIVLRDGKIVADRPAREVLRDVDLLEESSVMPLQVTRFFHEMRLWQGQSAPPTGRVGGEETTEQGLRRLGQTVGYVFQNPDHEIFSDTVLDEVAFGPKIGEMEEAEIEERVREALAAVGMEGRGDEDPFGLTKGERQRVAVASVLAVRPEVLILDEPTTGLDHAEQRSMMDLVKRLNEEGSTIIVVTHTMWVAAEYAHRAAVLRDGGVILSGTTREVFSQEDALRDASLRPPHIVTLGNALGFPVLSVEEMSE